MCLSAVLSLSVIFGLRHVHSTSDINTLSCDFQDFCGWHSEGGIVNWAVRNEKELSDLDPPPNVNNFILAEYGDQVKENEHWALLWSKNVIASVKGNYWISFYHCIYPNTTLRLEVKFTDDFTYELEPDITYESSIHWKNEDRELFDPEDEYIGRAFQVIIKAILYQTTSRVAISQFTVYEKPETTKTSFKNTRSLTISSLEDSDTTRFTTQLENTTQYVFSSTENSNSTDAKKQYLFQWHYILVICFCCVFGFSIFATLMATFKRRQK